MPDGLLNIYPEEHCCAEAVYPAFNFPEDIMLNIRVGDTVAFKRSVAQKCNSEEIATFRGVVTGIAGEWLFIEEASGRARVMPIDSMCRVASNGAFLEVV